MVVVKKQIEGERSCYCAFGYLDFVSLAQAPLTYRPCAMDLHQQPLLHSEGVKMMPPRSTHLLGFIGMEE
jgi:hypothetical protein